MKTPRERRPRSPGLALLRAGVATSFGAVLFAAGLVSFPLRAVEITTAAPTLLPPPSAESANTTTATTTSAAPGLTIEDCYREALLNNANIRSAHAAIEKATGTKIVLQSRALPTLTAQVFVGQQKPSHFTPRIVAILNSHFYQELYDASTPASFRKGRIGVATAQQNLYLTTVNELNALRLAYYQALAARENVAVQESIRTRLKANLTLQEQAALVGRVGKQDVDTAALRLAEIAPTLSSAQGDYRQARIELATRMGRDLDSDAATPSGKADLDSGLPLPKGPLEAVTFRIDYQAETDYALTHRPDLAALKLLIASSQSDIEIAEGGHLPLISTQANLSFIPKAILKKNTDGLPLTQLNEVLSASWLLVDGGAIRGATTTFESTREGYRIALRQLESDIPRNLRQISDALRTATAMVESSTLAVSLAEENYRITEAQIANGNATALDLLNSQSNLLNAQYTRINALLENNIAVAQFDTVTGRYLEFIPQEGDTVEAPKVNPSAKTKTSTSPANPTP